MRDAVRYCWRCGGELQGRLPTCCAQCGTEHFDHPRPCAEVVIERDGGVLFVRRKIEPWGGHWDIPGGFCERGEHPRATAVREVAEEVGLELEQLAFVGIWMDLYDHPTSASEPISTLNVCYLASVGPNVATAVDGVEADRLAWVSLERLPEDLAFPAHLRPALEAARTLLAARPDVRS